LPQIKNQTKHHMKKLLFPLMIAFSLNIHSQSNYFTFGTDTIFCKNVSYEATVQGYLKTISYTDTDGKSWEMSGKKNLENVDSFFIGGGFTDKIPADTDHPNSYVRWASRVVDGKLKVNYYTHNLSPGGSNFTSTFTKFVIKLPDGVYYDVRKNSDMKKHIIPFLQQCEAFNTAYQGNFETDFTRFVKMIQLYNSVCK